MDGGTPTRWRRFTRPTRSRWGSPTTLAKVVAPGRIAHTADAGPTFIGPYVDGVPLDRATTVGSNDGRRDRDDGDAGGEAGKSGRTRPQLRDVADCRVDPVGYGRLGASEPVLQVSDVLASEAAAVARALGFDVEMDERIAAIRGLLAKGGPGKASMLQDVEAQRKTEIEVVNGAVVREGERLGIHVSMNRAMVALIGGLERSWRQ